MIDDSNLGELSDSTSNLLAIVPLIIDPEDTADVMDEVEDLAASWGVLATYLRLNTSTIEDIRSKSSKCLFDTISEWLKQNYNTTKYGKPSWRQLAAGVRKLDRGMFERIATAHPKAKVLY